MIPISIHSSHTGRDIAPASVCGNDCTFQSTLPIREETWRASPRPRRCLFQSTLPIREETPFVPAFSQKESISIHSSHTGRDKRLRKRLGLSELFQSTLPIREETDPNYKPFTEDEFQSTLPIREETCNQRQKNSRLPISIHSSHTGRDPAPAIP